MVMKTIHDAMNISASPVLAKSIVEYFPMIGLSNQLVFSSDIVGSFVNGGE